jgi:hypothetical protein
LRRGEVAIARGFGGAVLVRRVWEVGKGLVYLSSDAEFLKLQAGDEGLPPIGFPASDVFAYDEAVAKGHSKPNWDQLEQWKPYRVIRASSK